MVVVVRAGKLMNDVFFGFDAVGISFSKGNTGILVKTFLISFCTFGLALLMCTRNSHRAWGRGNPSELVNNVVVLIAYRVFAIKGNCKEVNVFAGLEEKHLLH